MYQTGIILAEKLQFSRKYRQKGNMQTDEMPLSGCVDGFQIDPITDIYGKLAVSTVAHRRLP